VSDLGRPAVFRIIAILGVLLLSALVVALRRLSKRAALDEAEEVLRAELARYDDDDLP
jgi:hypothetical protein